MKLISLDVEWMYVDYTSTAIPYYAAYLESALGLVYKRIYFDMSPTYDQMRMKLEKWSDLYENI